MNAVVKEHPGGGFSVEFHDTDVEVKVRLSYFELQALTQAGNRELEGDW